jgi:hypothetical protein
MLNVEAACHGVVEAVVRYSMILAFVVVVLTIFRRPMGWHGVVLQRQVAILQLISIDEITTMLQCITYIWWTTHICIIAINIKHIPFLFMNRFPPSN